MLSGLNEAENMDRLHSAQYGVSPYVWVST